MESRGGNALALGCKLTLSEKLAEKKATFVSQSMDYGAAKGLSAHPPSGARPSSSHGGGARPASSRRSGESGGGTNMNAKPLALTCYLCGTQHFRQSLFIHISACQKKWVMVEEAKLPRERRPLPPPPPELTDDLPTTTAGIDRFNADMYAYWDRVSCVVCHICTRSFRPDAFEKHVKVCTPDTPGGPLGMPKGAAVSGRPPINPKQGGGGLQGGPPKDKGGGGSPQTGARPVSSRPPGGHGGGGGRGPDGGPNMSSKPRAFTCYLCGTQHFSRSLFIHIAQCQKKWIMVEEAKLPRERRPLPPPPPDLTEDLPTSPEGIDRFNNDMYAYWDRISLMVCRICTRSFRAEAYEKHAKVCTSDNPGGPLGLPKGVTLAAAKAAAAAVSGGGGPGGGPNMNAKPRAYMCYLCGTQHFSQSLLIHIPPCYDKWLKVQDQKDWKDRREPPPAPSELDQPLPTRPEEIDAFNQRMSDIFNGFSLVKCAHCGRTMQPEALVRHQKACTAATPMKSVTGSGTLAGATAAGGNSGKDGGVSPGSQSALKPALGGGGGASGSPSSPAGLVGHPPTQQGGPSEQSEEDIDMEECPNCGRRMRAEVLGKHNKMCTPEKPMKSVKRSSTASLPTAAVSSAAGPGAPPRPPALAPSSPGPASLNDHHVAPSPPTLAPAGPASLNDHHVAPSPPPLAPAGPASLNDHHVAPSPPPFAPGPASNEHPVAPSPPPVPRPPGVGGRRLTNSEDNSHSALDVPKLSESTPTPAKSSTDAQAATPVDQAPKPSVTFENLDPPTLPSQPPVSNPSNDAIIADGEDIPQGERIHCETCGRGFLSVAFEKHSRICAKVFASKRKAFDSSKARLSGTEAADSFGGPAGRKAVTSAPTRLPTTAPKPSGPNGSASGTVPKWKAQSDSLRAAMENMKQVKEAMARGEPLPPPIPSAPDPSLVQCPHCGRRFNANAAERHIPSCANTVSKPNFLKRGTGGSGAGAPQSKPLPKY